MAFGWSEDSLWAGNRRVFFFGDVGNKGFFPFHAKCIFPLLAIIFGRLAIYPFYFGDYLPDFGDPCQQKNNFPLAYFSSN